MVVTFLPIGHTREGIDQMLVKHLPAFATNFGITVSNLHDQLRFSNHGNTIVKSFNQLNHGSGLFHQDCCVRPINMVSQSRYFKFGWSGKKHEGELMTLFQCKMTSQEKCKLLISSTPRILKSIPDLRGTPALNIVCSMGLDEVTKRLVSDPEWFIDTKNIFFVWVEWSCFQSGCWPVSLTPAASCWEIPKRLLWLEHAYGWAEWGRLSYYCGLKQHTKFWGRGSLWNCWDYSWTCSRDYHGKACA